MSRPQRNFTGVQFESLRLVIDASFNTFSDELEEAFYGNRQADGSLDKTTGWRAGVSKPFRGFNKRATPALSQALFEKIQGALHQIYMLVLHDENVTQGLPFSRSDYDKDLPSRAADDIVDAARQARRVLTSQERTDLDAALTSATPVKVIEDRRTALKGLRTNDLAVFNMLQTWATSQSFNIDPDRTD